MTAQGCSPTHTAKKKKKKKGENEKKCRLVRSRNRTLHTPESIQKRDGMEDGLTLDLVYSVCMWKV